MRTLIKDTPNKIGETIELSGWIDVRRDHGKLIFIDLRDRTGLVQVVFIPSEAPTAHKLASTIRSEWVVTIKGKVNARPDKMVNPDLPTGTIEVAATSLTILSESDTPPFPIDSEGYDINEETRMTYRYLDLRRSRLATNIKTRHRVVKLIRDFLSHYDFLEIETPILTKSTPEGARDYLVPARLYPGNFYALPQAPQQYKQLLMASGLERYFQLAHVFRDEDTRGDRQPEFTQLDMELSFTTESEIRDLNEKLLIKLVTELYPNKTITKVPFPILTYKEAMDQYGTDRPDLRRDFQDKNELAFCWVVDFPFFEKDETTGRWTFTHNPFSAPKEEFHEDLLAKRNIESIIAAQYDIALNGLEIGGGSLRNYRPEALRAVLEIIGQTNQDIEANFGHMLKAFTYGAPPHGGIAWGLDRLMMILQNEPNIREVIAFPKTGDGRDLLMNAPSPATAEQLKELGLNIKKSS